MQSYIEDWRTKLAVPMDGQAWLLKAQIAFLQHWRNGYSIDFAEVKSSLEYQLPLSGGEVSVNRSIRSLNIDYHFCRLQCERKLVKLSS